MTASRPHTEFVAQVREALDRSGPRGAPWLREANAALDRLEEQLEALQRAIRNAGVKAQVDEALTARYYQAPSPARES